MEERKRWGRDWETCLVEDNKKWEEAIRWGAEAGTIHGRRWKR